MSAGAYWGRNLAPGGIRWHDLSQPVIAGSSIMPGQGATAEVMRWRPQ